MRAGDSVVNWLGQRGVVGWPGKMWGAPWAVVKEEDGVTSSSPASWWRDAGGGVFVKTRWSLRLEGHRWIWANWEAHAVDGNGEWCDAWSWHRGFVTLCLAAWRPRMEADNAKA